jgi:hypothetical protein
MKLNNDIFLMLKWTMGKQTIVKEVYNFLILVGYSQICIKRLPLGQRKDGLLKQMTS